ncbi:hypothetical protein KBB68_02405 [Candidatus Babeliales bacterium]|nr:hypothetical protein [Candidatus Babeliales bacterium]
MNNLKLIFISITLLFCGIFFFLYQESWIIINLPSNNIAQPKTLNAIQPKDAILWIFKDETLKKETTEIIFSNDHVQTIKQLLNHWLTTLEEEHIIDKQITVQSVILSSSGQDAFICFQENFLNKQASCFTKMMILESMLKTLRDAKLGIINVRFLVHHQPMLDHHFNFDISWPIAGYVG